MEEKVGTNVDYCTDATFTVGHAESATEMYSRRDQVSGAVGNHDNYDNATAHDSGGTSDLFAYGMASDNSPGWDNFTNYSGGNHVETWDSNCS
jgi:hypothetical protein